VIITDQAMPGMTGIELIGKIREKRPSLPIILASGWAELPDNPVPEFLRLSKPYRQEDLAAAISRVLSKTEQ
jgi:YesN/AraC family two-component response regulator